MCLPTSSCRENCQRVNGGLSSVVPGTRLSYNRTGSKVEQVALPCVVLIYRRRESPTEIISSVCPKPAERASARASRRRSHVGLAASSSTTTGAILPTW